MILKSITTAISLFFYSLVYSQTIERSCTFGASGSSASNASIQIQSNIGELMVETYTGTSSVFSQGFAQPELPVLVSVVNYDKINGGIVFPNPVSKQLFVRLDWQNLSGVIIEVFDILGKKQLVDIKKGQFAEDSSFELNFENMESGTYFIHVISSDKQMNEVFKINKCE